MKLNEFYNTVLNRLTDISGNEAALEAKLMLCHALNITQDKFFLKLTEEISDDCIESVNGMLSKRSTGCPLQYIFGKWYFFGNEFIVTPACLIPRQDTEVLCEEAIRLIRRNGYKTLLDMCTGSGCIGISIAKETDVCATLADISVPALKIASQNARLNKVNVALTESDLFSNIKEKYDIITINPPYLTKSDMDNLQREVSFEPYNALFGGNDGLLFYRRISHEINKYINDGGALILEIGMTQGKAVLDIFNNNGVVIKDFAGNDRVVVVGY